MQLMIDIEQETADSLQIAVAFLTQHIARKRTLENIIGVPVGTPTAANPPAPPAPPQNVIPFPTAPPVPVVSSVAPVVPMVPAVAPLAAMGGTALSEDYDSAGIPWDVRVHQKKKSKKQDGTWKIQKGLPDSTVQGVMQEMFTLGRVRPPLSAPAAPVGAAAPVTLPQTQAPQAPAQGVPPAPGYPQASQAQALQVPQAPVSLPTVPVPPAAAVGVPDAGQSSMVPEAVTPYRALIARLGVLKNENRITSEQISACCAQAGVPSLQMLGSMTHLVPQVSSFVDAILLTG